MTGYPKYSERGGMTYSDVDANEILLKMKVSNVCGTCRMLSHPEWSINVYPATLFTTAPMEEVKRVLQEMKEI